MDVYVLFRREHGEWDDILGVYFDQAEAVAVAEAYNKAHPRSAAWLDVHTTVLVGDPDDGQACN